MRGQVRSMVRSLELTRNRGRFYETVVIGDVAIEIVVCAEIDRARCGQTNSHLVRPIPRSQSPIVAIVMVLLWNRARSSPLICSRIIKSPKRRQNRIVPFFYFLLSRCFAHIEQRFCCVLLYCTICTAKYILVPISLVLHIIMCCLIQVFSIMYSYAMSPQIHVEPFFCLTADLCWKLCLWFNYCTTPLWCARLYAVVLRLLLIKRPLSARLKYALCYS